jgi:uncharacterized protein YecE (DUF72 family)
MAGSIRVGVSGWTYKPWRGVFYPDTVRQKDELAYAATQLTSIEINGTFYSLQTPASFGRWAADTPAGFVFSIKAPRYITHIRRGRDVAGPVANFLASGLFRLGPKLGPILWQFPPSFRYSRDTMEEFLARLPHDAAAGLAVARGHDDWMRERAWVEQPLPGPLLHAIEIRHASFATAEFIDLLRRHRVALVCADTADWPRLMDVTADFIYCRLHGTEPRYAGGYDAEAIDTWARRVRVWAKGGEPDDAERLTSAGPEVPAGRDVYVYFDNDHKVRAPIDARSLIERLAPGG